VGRDAPKTKPVPSTRKPFPFELWPCRRWRKCASVRPKTLDRITRKPRREPHEAQSAA